MIHITAFVVVLHLPPDISTFVILPIAMAWYGAAIARLVSMLVDSKQNGQGGINRYWVMLELVVGTLIISNFFQFLS